MGSSKENLISAVAELILERGYGGTSVDAVCERAGVSKGSFFHHFRTKEEAACATLDSWFAGIQQQVEGSGVLLRKDPATCLLGYLDFFCSMLEQPDAPQGCLLGSLALEVSGTHPDVREKAVQHFESWSESIARLIQSAIGDSDSRRALPLANHLIATLEGALLLAKAKKDRSLIRSSLEHYRNYIQTLFPD